MQKELKFIKINFCLDHLKFIILKKLLVYLINFFQFLDNYLILFYSYLFLK